jgi:hypothetical protein
VCAACDRTKEIGDPAFLSRAHVESLLNSLATRVASGAPLRASDDHENWDWRQFVAQRKALRATKA